MIRRRSSTYSSTTGGGGVEEKKDADSVASNSYFGMPFISSSNHQPSNPSLNLLVTQTNPQSYGGDDGLYLSHRHGNSKFNAPFVQCDNHNDNVSYRDSISISSSNNPANGYRSPNSKNEGFQAQMESLAKTLFTSCNTMVQDLKRHGEVIQSCSSPLCGHEQTQQYTQANGNGAGVNGGICTGVGGDDDDGAGSGGPLTNMMMLMMMMIGRGGEQCNGAPCDAPSKAPLSIADELRLLAAKEGRVFHSTGGYGIRRRADIPQYLGEQAVYSFEDDNISAISQNTLEELARHGVRFPVIRRIPTEDFGHANPHNLNDRNVQQQFSQYHQSILTDDGFPSSSTSHQEHKNEHDDYQYDDEHNPNRVKTSKKKKKKVSSKNRANHCDEHVRKSRHTKSSSTSKQLRTQQSMLRLVPPPVPESHLEDLTMMSSS